VVAEVGLVSPPTEADDWAGRKHRVCSSSPSVLHNPIDLDPHHEYGGRVWGVIVYDII